MPHCIQEYSGCAELHVACFHCVLLSKWCHATGFESTCHKDFNPRNVVVSPRKYFPESSNSNQLWSFVGTPIFQPSWHQVVFANESIPSDAQQRSADLFRYESWSLTIPDLKEVGCQKSGLLASDHSHRRCEMRLCLSWSTWLNSEGCPSFLH